MIERPFVSKDFRVYQLPDGLELECSLVDKGMDSEFMYAEILHDILLLLQYQLKKNIDNNLFRLVRGVQYNQAYSRCGARTLQSSWDCLLHFYFEMHFV